MTTKTYAQLGTLPSVNDTDLIAGWRASGPLKTYTALIVKAYMAADSLPLAGGTMTGALKLISGSEGAPALAFSAETTTGLYRSGAGNLDISILGTRRLNLSATGLNVYGALAASGALSGTNATLSGTLALTGAATLSSTLAVSGAATMTGGYVNGLATKTANYTLVAADAGKTIIFATNTGLTLTAPASTLPDGARVKIINNSGGTLAVSNNGGAFYDGLSSPIANGDTFWIVGNAAKPIVCK